MNTHLQYAGFIYVLYIAVFFFLKKKVKSMENKLYGGLIIHTMIMFFINIGSRIVPTKFALTFPPIFILTKLNFCLTAMFFIKFALYIYVTSSDNNEEFTELEDNPHKDKLKKQTTIMRIASIIACIPLIALPFDISVTEDRLIFLTGPVMYVYYGILIINIIAWIVLLLKSNLKNKKFNAILFYIILAILTLVLQFTIKGVDFIATYIGLLIVLMYNTIENPDINLIRKLKIAKKEADEANQAKTEFLSRMSHEIRTPLNAIVGFGQALTKEDIPVSAKEDTADIIMASNTLLDIVNGILDIQKIEANKIELVNDEYKTKRMVNEVTSLINARIGSKPIDFKILIDENLPPVLYGDVIRVKQIIINLLTNATKYTNEGRILFQIKVSNIDDICKLTFEVSDTGIGMTEENIAQLFNKFERFDAAKNINVEGSGLGMAITKGLIDLMNGEINVKSKYGEGTTFIVTIDQKIIKKSPEEIVEAEPISTVKAFDASGSRVLVVDDNKINIKVAERLLKDYKVEVEAVTSGEECINYILNGEKFDIIFMDIMMPKMNGVQALENLKSIVGFNMPVVALTADVISGMEDKYISQGFDDCLAKPIVEEELYYMLRKYLQEVSPTMQQSPEVEESAPVVVEQPVLQTIETPTTTSLEIPIQKEQVVQEEAPAIELPTIVEHTTIETPVVETPAVAKTTEVVEQPVEQPAPVVESAPAVEIISPELTGVDLLKANKVNVDAGLELLKDMEMYDMTLEEFFNELQNKLTDLENYKNEGNMDDYAILAHALKTEARYVGCAELGDIAYEHELAGKDKNQDLVNEKFAELKGEANRVYKVVEKYFNK